MKKIHLVFFAAIFLLVIAVLCLRPVPIVPEENCLTLKAIVTEVYEDGVNDVVIKLRGQDKTFYVNRGLERGLNLESLQAELIGREITVKYPNYWTPLDPGKTNIHLSKIELDGRTVFTEL